MDKVVLDSARGLLMRCIILIVCLIILSGSALYAELNEGSAVYISNVESISHGDSVTRAYTVNGDNLDDSIRGFLLEFFVKDCGLRNVQWKCGELIGGPLCLTQYDEKKEIYRVSVVRQENIPSKGGSSNLGVLTLNQNIDSKADIEIIRVEVIDNQFNEYNLITPDETRIKQDTKKVVKSTGITGIYPNPFNPNIVIKYYLEHRMEVSAVIYDCSGKMITILECGLKTPGNHVIEWNGRDKNSNNIASGIYFLRLRCGDKIESRKLILLK